MVVDCLLCFTLADNQFPCWDNRDTFDLWPLDLWCADIIGWYRPITGKSVLVYTFCYVPILELFFKKNAWTSDFKMA